MIKTIFTFGLILIPSILFAQVSGFVRDAATTLPIEGARVSLQTSTTAITFTLADGSFNLTGAIGTDLTIVAAAVGYFNLSRVVTTPTSTLDFNLELVPIGNNPNYVLASPAACGGCHPQQFSEWADSPMNKAGVNTWVYDIYNGTGSAGGLGGFVYTRDSTFAATNPESECASCHQPEPWIDEPFTALEPIGALSQGSLHGVSCEVCHKIASVDVSKINYPGLHPEAMVFNRPIDPFVNPIVYGALGDTDFSLSIMRPSYQPQLMAEVCGTCHQDANDHDEDGDFEDPGSVVSEPTYWEWANSAYGDPNSPSYKTCVDCHMPPSGVNIVSPILNPPLLRDPNTIRSHNIRGTTPEYLENSCDVSIATNIAGNSLEVTVTVENSMVGHHVPTGVTIRNMILLVTAKQVQNGQFLTPTGTQWVHDLGGIGDPAEGYYGGEPGKYFGKVNHAADGTGPTFFTDATGIIFDSRIPALESDISQYSFEIPPAGGEVQIEAKLIYRRSFRFLTDAKNWTTDGHGHPLADIQPPYYGHLMEQEFALASTPSSSNPFVRGDVSDNGNAELDDAIQLLDYLFLGSSIPNCEDSADVNDSGTLDLADAVFLLSYLFTGGSPPPGPGPLLCGIDPTPDMLGTCSAQSCP